MALRGIEWVKLVFPDMNILVHVTVHAPEKVWSHALKAKFRKYGTNPCKQKLSGAIVVNIQCFVIKRTTRYRSAGQKVAKSGTFTRKYAIYRQKQWVMPHQQSLQPT